MVVDVDVVVDVVVERAGDVATDVEFGVSVVAAVKTVVAVLGFGASVETGRLGSTGATDTGAAVLTMTTIDGSGGATVVAGSSVATTLVLTTVDGILASASSSRVSKSPTLPLRLLASATAASRLSRSLDSRSEDRMFNVTPTSVTIADSTAPTRMA